MSVIVRYADSCDCPEGSPGMDVLAPGQIGICRDTGNLYTGTTGGANVLVGPGAGGGGASPLTTKGDIYVYSTIDTRLPVGPNGQVLTADSTTATGLKWAAVGGTGTVTSVALTAPSPFSVGGSPVTAAGTLALSWVSQAQNAVLAGPAAGGAAAPTFRALVDADIPAAIARDSEVTAAISAHEAAADPHSVYTTTTELTNYAQPLDADLTAISDLTGTNTIYYRSGTSAWSPVTFSGLTFAGGVLTATGDGGVADGNKGDITVSGTGFTWDINPGVVGNVELRDSSATSVIGRSTSTPGDPADIQASSNNTVLRRVADALSFGELPIDGLGPINLETAAAPAVYDSVLGYSTAAAGNRTYLIGRIAGLILSGVCGLRLSTESNLENPSPISIVDRTARTTVYLRYYKGNQIVLFDDVFTADYLQTLFAELSCVLSDTTKSPAAVAADLNYDLFVWDDAGTLRLSRGPAWASNNVRGDGSGTTALVFFKGRYVNSYAITNGPGQNLGTYVGTIRGTGAGITEDSNAKRFVWNMYNREPRAMSKNCEGGSHTTTTGATHMWGNEVAPAGTYGPRNRFEFVCGIGGVVLDITVSGELTGGTASGRGMIGLGVNTTTGANITSYHSLTSVFNLSISGRTTALLGYNYCQAVEASIDGQVVNLYTCVITGDLMA